MLSKEDLKNERFVGSLLSYVFTVISLLVSFIYVPILLKYLGKAEYGLYQMVASFFAYISIFETSASSGVLRYYCNAKAKNDETAMESVLAISRYIFRIISVILVFIGAILIFGFTVFYESSLSEQQLIESVFMLIALIINMIITMLNSVYLATIIGNERFIFVKSLSIIILILQPLLCCLAAVNFPYALTIVVGQLVVNIIAAVIRIIYAKRSLKVKIVYHEKNKELTRSILLFAGSILLAVIADQIFWKADQIIIGKMYNTILVAVYSIGSQIYICYMHIGTSITSIFFPKISELYLQEDGLNKISDLFIKFGRIVSFVLFVVLSGFIIFGKEFLNYWIGGGYDEAYYVALYVMIPFTIDLVQNIGLSILQVMNKYTFRAKMYFVGALLNIIMTVFMTKHMGIRGAALSTGITMLITSGLILNIYYIKIGLRIKEFWFNIVSILFKIFPYFIIMFLLNNVLIQLLPGIAGFIARIMIYTVGYFVIVVCWAMNQEERSIVGIVFRKKIV